MFNLKPGEYKPDNPICTKVNSNHLPNIFQNQGNIEKRISNLSANIDIINT